jgi:hypothetical protein
MAIDKSFDKTKYPHAAYAAAQMDACVMVEPIFVCDSIPQDGNVMQVLHWIGDQGDRTVGIFESEFSPRFSSLAELDAFCFGARNEYDLLAEMTDIPEKLFWEEPLVNS